MKILLLLFLIGFSFVGIAQECRNVKKIEKELQGYTLYESPNSPTIVVRKVIDKDSTMFVLSLLAFDRRVFYSSSGAFIKLENGEVLRQAQNEVDLEIGRYSNGYSALFYINEENIKLLSTQSIVKYGVGNIENEINKKEGAKILEFVTCMNKLK